jgi:signal transduction histidine kinase
MMFRGEAIGVVQVMNRYDKAHYTEDDVTILETLTAQASSSILSTLMLEETKRAYEELEELEKMKSDFIAIASHELRTPLGLILGHSADLHDQIKNKEQQHQLDVIMRSATRLKKLIDDLSNVNSFQTGKTRVHSKSVNLNNLINEIVNHFLETAQAKHISLRAQLPKNEVSIGGDEEKLALVLSNLVENALMFTDVNGHALVSLETLPGYIKVSVIDSGIGIPAKDLPRVFDRFYQVESHLTRRHGGLGLGLSVAKAMVEMHDGQIWAESVEGQGSNFTFLLPVKGDRERTKPLGIKTPALSKPFV